LLAAVFSLSSVAFSEPARSPVLTSGRLEQVALTVTDLDKARSFYRDTLGLRLIFEANRMLFFDVSGTRLMIAHDRDRQRPAHAAGILYFHVDDFAAALGRLRRSGAPLVGDIETVQSSSSGSLMGLIRFRGHLPKGGYDVPHAHTEAGAPSAPTVH